MLRSQTVTITFDATGGSLLTASKTAEIGKEAGRLPLPTRKGYDFDGWYISDSPSGTPIRFSERSTVPDCDITLYAQWKCIAGNNETRKNSKKNKKKVSVVRIERIATIAVAVLIVALTVVMICTNGMVNEKEFRDVDGAYYFVRQGADGLYSLYDSDGKELKTDMFGYYITRAGSALYVDADEGKYTLMDDVLYPEDGEESASAARVRLFAKITDIASMEVRNEFGTYTFVKDKNGEFVIKGHESIAYSEEIFAYLRSVCSNTIMIEKLDSPIVDENGEFSEYGLTEKTVTDGDGNTVTKRPASFTVTDGKGKSYTVLIGDKVLSNDGYYVQLVGRNAVYVADNSYYDQTVMCGIESFVTPLTVNMSGMFYFDVRDFALVEYDYSLYDQTLDENDIKQKILTAFTFIPGSDRKDFELTRPYKLQQNYVEGYYASEQNIYSHVLMQLYKMTYERVCMIGLGSATDEQLEKYGMINSKYMMTFDSYTDYLYDTDNEYVFLDANGEYVYYTYSSNLGKFVYVYVGDDGQLSMYNGKASDLSSPYVYQDKNGNKVYYRYIKDLNGCRYVYLNKDGTVSRYYSKDRDGDLNYAYDWTENVLIISEKTENGTYYVGAPIYDMIVEVDAMYLDFLLWDDVKWVDKYPIFFDIGYMSEFKLSLKGEYYHFILDNSKSNTSSSDQSISQKLEVYNGITGEQVTTQLFRKLFRTLLYTQIHGTVDLTEQEMQAIRENPDNSSVNGENSKCIAELYYKTTSGEEFVFRFYEYEQTGLNAYMTINGKGIYYIKTSWLKTLATNADKVVNGIDFEFSDR